MNFASYVIEVLSLDSDRAVSLGELGRVVVTDLFSHAMPLIRYDTGDLAILGDACCSCDLPGPTLHRIEGRCNEEVVAVDGRRIPPVVIGRELRYLEGVTQFQFAQKGEKSYELRLCIVPSFHQEKSVHRRLIDILGAGAQLKLSYVEQIPPLPSGKRPYVVNEWRRHRTAE